MSTPNLKIKVSSDGAPRVIEVTKSSATLGSAAHCDVRLDHPSIEPEHARAWREGGRLWVQDLGSTAGTFLNGNRLPAMKPMLVRDLDGLKLGEARETLGFDKTSAEPIRAPRVTPPPVPPPAPAPAAPTFGEYTLTDIRPSLATSPADPDDARQRDERARVGRELAELRLQLQMAQLEKTSAAELRAELNELRADLNRLEDERREFKASLAKTRDAEAQRQAQVEAAIVEQKAKADRDVADLRTQQNRRFAQMKTDLVAEATRQVRQWLHDRGLPRDVAQSLETELGQILRGVGDGTQNAQNSVPNNVMDITRPRPVTPAAQAPAPAAPVAAAAAGEPAPRRRNGSRKAILVGVGLVFAAGGLGVYSLRLRSGGADRAPASTYRQAKDHTIRPSHAENIIRTEGYVDLIRGPAWRKARAIELAKAPWNFDAPTIRALLDREANLVRDLALIFDRAPAGREQDAITAMHSREAEYMHGLLVSFQNDTQAYDRFNATEITTLQRLLPR